MRIFQGEAGLSLRRRAEKLLLRRISESGAIGVRISESASPQGLTRNKHMFMQKRKSFLGLKILIFSAPGFQIRESRSPAIFTAPSFSIRLQNNPFTTDTYTYIVRAHSGGKWSAPLHAARKRLEKTGSALSLAWDYHRSSHALRLASASMP